MVAAAFTQTLVFKGTSNGRTIHIPASVSDVAAEFATYPDGSNTITLPSDQNYALIDVVVVTGGTDTNFQDIFVNQLSSGVRIGNKSNLNTAFARVFMSAPVTFRAGSQIKLKQSAA